MCLVRLTFLVWYWGAYLPVLVMGDDIVVVHCRRKSRSRHAGYVRMYVCMDVWMYGCMDVCLLGRATRCHISFPLFLLHHSNNLVVSVCMYVCMVGYQKLL